MAAVASVASGWSEQISTSESTGWSISPSSLAGTWCSAAATLALGTAAWTLAATDPRGGTSGWNSWATRARALHIDTTTLPLRWPSTDCTVAAAASHGVASTIRSQSAAVSLSPESIGSSLSGQTATSLSRASMARYFERDPRTTSNPTLANRTARPRPAGPVPPRTPMRIGPRVA